MKSLSFHRLLFYVVGLFILTFGISATIVSTLGTSPFDALLVGLFKTFGLTVGSWEIIVGAVLVIVNACIERKFPDILAMLTAFFTGAGIDFWLFVMKATWEPEHVVGQSILLALGIIFIGLGIATYLQANFIPSPLDRTMLLVRDLCHVKVSTAKTFVMIVFLILAYFFNGPIWIGTLIMAVGSGPCVGFFFPIMERIKKSADQKWETKQAVQI